MKTAGWQPYVVLGVGVSAVAWAAILVREADAPGLISAACGGGRASIPRGALAVVQHRRAPEPISTGTVAPLVLSAAFLAAHFAFWIASLQRTSVVTAVVLMATQPLIVGIAAPLLLGEAVDRRVWLALAVALAGTAAMAIEDAGEALGTQLIGPSAINWSLAYLPVMIVAMAILVEPVGSTILATVILDEWPSGVEMEPEPAEECSNWRVRR